MKNNVNVKMKKTPRRLKNGKIIGTQKREETRGFGKLIMKIGKLLKKKIDKEEYLPGR